VCVCFAFVGVDNKLSSSTVHISEYVMLL